VLSYVDEKNIFYKGDGRGRKLGFQTEVQTPLGNAGSKEEN
jgi:hypothetical protein